MKHIQGDVSFLTSFDFIQVFTSSLSLQPTLFVPALLKPLELSSPGAPKRSNIIIFHLGSNSWPKDVGDEKKWKNDLKKWMKPRNRVLFVRLLFQSQTLGANEATYRLTEILFGPVAHRLSPWQSGHKGGDFILAARPCNRKERIPSTP